MDEKLEQLKALLKRHFDEERQAIREDASEAKADMLEDLVQTEDRIALALAATPPDFAHVTQELTGHLPAVAAREKHEMREKRRESLWGRVRAIFTEIMRIGFGAALMLALLVVVPGCAAMKKGNVMTPMLRKEMTNVCKAIDACVDADKLGADVVGCDTANPGSLISRMKAQNVVEGSSMLMELGEVCGAVNQCVASWPDLPEHQRLAWPEWCETLKENARAAG